MCTTRTYTRRHAARDTVSYLVSLWDDGIRDGELDDARSYALEQWHEWPDGEGCTQHAKAG